MNLQSIIRAAVCAATVAACLVGAGWLPTHAVAGQEANQTARSGVAEQAVEYGQRRENDSPGSVAPANPARSPQTYRPGLRNSFVGYPLSAKELNLVLTQLRHKTGFVRARFDEAGFLTIDDRSQIAGGSATARELLLAAIDGKKSINLQSHNRSPEVTFAQLNDGVNYMSRQGDREIVIAPIEIDFTDFKHLQGHREAVEAFDPGFVILHELCHAVLELRDTAGGEDAAGDCERYVNRIRRELGMPERQQYVATTSWKAAFSFSPTVRIAKLIFAQTRPGHEPGSRAKRKMLYIKWDVERVGNIRRHVVPPAAKEKTGAGVTAP